MTTLEFTDFMKQEVSALWPSWKLTKALIDTYAEEFARHRTDELKAAFRKHKTEKDYQEPKIPMVKKILWEIVEHRKCEERKNQPEWPGQVFVIVHRDENGKADFWWDFHVAPRQAEVPEALHDERLRLHIGRIEKSHGRYFPKGRFVGHVVTEEQATGLIRDIRTGLRDAVHQEFAAKACLAVMDNQPMGQVFKEMVANIAAKSEGAFKKCQPTPASAPAAPTQPKSRHQEVIAAGTATSDWPW